MTYNELVDLWFDWSLEHLTNFFIVLFIECFNKVFLHCECVRPWGLWCFCDEKNVRPHKHSFFFPPKYYTPSPPFYITLIIIKSVEGCVMSGFATVVNVYCILNKSWNAWKRINFPNLQSRHRNRNWSCFFIIFFAWQWWWNLPLVIIVY